jgi:hypothetical protein
VPQDDRRLALPRSCLPEPTQSSISSAHLHRTIDLNCIAPRLHEDSSSHRSCPAESLRKEPNPFDLAVWHGLREQMPGVACSSFVVRCLRRGLTELEAEIRFQSRSPAPEVGHS